MCDFCDDLDDDGPLTCRHPACIRDGEHLVSLRLVGSETSTVLCSEHLSWGIADAELNFGDRICSVRVDDLLPVELLDDMPAAFRRRT